MFHMFWLRTDSGINILNLANSCNVPGSLHLLLAWLRKYYDRILGVSTRFTKFPKMSMAQ